MSTYDGAYTNKETNSSVLNRKTEQFKVCGAEFIDSYHYHGSWFEYTWKLQLEDKVGTVFVREMDTWVSYKPNELIGNMITYNQTVFELMRG